MCGNSQFERRTGQLECTRGESALRYAQLANEIEETCLLQATLCLIDHCTLPVLSASLLLAVRLLKLLTTRPISTSAMLRTIICVPSEGGNRADQLSI